MMIPRELVPLPGGRLAEICPKEILETCRTELEVHLDFRLGKWQKTLRLTERHLDTVPGKSVKVQLFLDNDIIEAFVDGCSALLRLHLLPH